MAAPPVAPSRTVAGRRRQGGLAALVVAFVVSQTGEAMVLIALPWFVLETTGSVTSMGLVAATAAAAAAVTGLLAGPAADRIGLKRTLVLSYLVGGLSMAAIPVAHALGRRDFWLVLLCTAGASAFDAPARAAVTGLIGHLARASGLRLESANSMFQGIAHLVYLVGPAIGGLVVAAVGPAWLLIADAVGCVFGALLIAVGVRFAPPRRETPESPEEAADAPDAAPRRRGRYVRELAEGLSMIRRHGLLRALTVSTMVLGALDAAVIGVLLVAYGKSALGGAAGFGAMVTAYSVGALGGAVLYAGVGHRLPRRGVYLGGYLVIGALFGLLALTPPAPVVFLALGLAGLATAPVDTVRTAAMQELVPVSLFGRVAGARATLNDASAPLAIALCAALLPALGLSATLGAVAAAYVLVIAVYSRNRSLRGLDTARHDLVVTPS